MPHGDLKSTKGLGIYDDAPHPAEKGSGRGAMFFSARFPIMRDLTGPKTWDTPILYDGHMRDSAPPLLTLYPPIFSAGIWRRPRL